MIRVRLARPEDAEAASRIMIRSIRDLCVADHGNDPDRIAAWTANKTPQSVARWIAGSGAVLLALDTGRPAGVCGYSERGHIMLNYVDPDHRFRGISRAMLRNMETALAAHGIGTAHLDSTETARRFYLANGWEPDGDPAPKFGMPGYPMRKRLGGPE